MPLLAYLADRDRVLERERDRVLHEVLEEFAVGLTPRERRAVASRVGEAVDRHRDGRDAARFRRTQAGEPELDIPSVPGVVARLSEPLPTPARPAPRRSGLRPAPKSAPSGARKAPAKSAPKPPAKAAAKKATKAPAKAPAKSTAKAPAKKAPVAKKAAPARKKSTPAPVTTVAEQLAPSAAPSAPALPTDAS